MSFLKYPEYKNSGVDWLGAIPAHWEVGSFRRLIDSVSNGTTTEQVDEADNTVAVSRIETISGGTINFEKVGYVNFTDSLKRFLLVDGDILFSHINSLPMVGNAAIYRSAKPLLHGMNLLRIRSASSVVNDWILYWLKSKCIREEVESRAKPAINQASISTGSVRALPALIPTTFEQTQIARFLDHETAKIDTLIHEQKRLIELLKEKRQAVISHAVTKGLDPNVPMKDSGVEWLGEVPAHWVTTPIKRVINLLEQGWSPQCENQPVESTEEFGVLKVGCVNRGVFRPTENKRLPQELSAIPELTVKAGDLLISRANTRELVGSAAVSTMDHPNLMISDKLFRIRLNQNMATPHFVSFFLGTPEARLEIETSATGASSSMLNIGQGTILNMPFPRPPASEQEQIVEEVTKQTRGLSVLMRETTDLMALLHERRSALISAAVTGKIDVRHWQPPADGSALDEEVRETGLEITA